MINSIDMCLNYGDTYGYECFFVRIFHLVKMLMMNFLSHITKKYSMYEWK